jgi:hypothetical protein
LKEKLQPFREDVDSFEKSVVRVLAEIKCALEVIMTYDLAHEGIVEIPNLIRTGNIRTASFNKGRKCLRE